MAIHMRDSFLKLTAFVKNPIRYLRLRNEFNELFETLCPKTQQGLINILGQIDYDNPVLIIDGKLLIKNPEYKIDDKGHKASDFFKVIGTCSDVHEMPNYTARKKTLTEFIAFSLLIGWQSKMTEIVCRSTRNDPVFLKWLHRKIQNNTQDRISAASTSN